MKLYSETIYHIYNQGNNGEIIFKGKDDYLHFEKRIEILVKPYCDILAYCLMPNHFHFMIRTSEIGVKPITIGNIVLQELTNSFRILLSKYAKDFNRINQRSGSLFRQKTKYKLVDNGDISYPKNVFNYIMSNPLKAGIVDKLDEWEFCSYSEFIGHRKSKLCNLKLAKEILQLDSQEIKTLNEGYGDIPKFGQTNCRTS